MPYPQFSSLRVPSANQRTYMPLGTATAVGDSPLNAPTEVQARQFADAVRRYIGSAGCLKWSGLSDAQKVQFINAAVQPLGYAPGLSFNLFWKRVQTLVDRLCPFYLIQAQTNFQVSENPVPSNRPAGQIQERRYAAFMRPVANGWIHPAGQAASQMSTQQLIAALGTAAAGVANNIASQIGQTDRQRLTDTMQQQYAQFMAQQQMGNTSPAVQQQLDMLTTALARLGQQPASQMSTGMVAALILGGVAVLGLGYVALRPRHNPTEFRRTKHGYRAKKFVPSAWLK